MKNTIQLLGSILLLGVIACTQIDSKENAASVEGDFEFLSEQFADLK